MEIPKPDIPITNKQLTDSTVKIFTNSHYNQKHKISTHTDLKAPLGKKQPVPILIGNR